MWKNQFSTSTWDELNSSQVKDGFFCVSGLIGPHVNFFDVVFAISFRESGKHGLLVLCLLIFMDNSVMSHKLCPC
jgi:hypothetical protein